MKRFVETMEWDSAWFRGLPPAYKCLWQYIHARCDNAGVWQVDIGLASFQIGQSIDEQQALGHFTGRVEFVSEGKWWIVGFVKLQCGWPLKEKSPPHAHVIKLLNGHGLLERLEEIEKGVTQPF